MMDAFKKADEVLLNAVQGISDLINHTGLINSDFADVRTIMQNKGLALMGIGQAEGENRAVEAATAAISSPLLEDVSIEGATGIIINITGSSSLSIHEVNEATTLIMEAAHEDAEIIFGTVIDENLNDKVKVTVIATGLGGANLAATAAIHANASAQVQPAPMMQAPTGAQAASMMNHSYLAQQAAASSMMAQPAMAQQSTTIHNSNNAVMHSNDQLMSAPSIPVPPAPNAAMLGQNDAHRMNMGAGAEGGDLARARALATKLGISSLTDDEYDVPTYIRRQQDRDLNA